MVIDRVKDLAATAQGVRFSPQFIENKLKFSPYIGECVVLGNGRPAIVAILCIRYSMVAKWAESQSLVYTTYTTFSALPEVYDLIGARSCRSMPRCRRANRSRASCCSTRSSTPTTAS